jgi:hypothetical protein
MRGCAAAGSRLVLIGGYLLGAILIGPGPVRFGLAQVTQTDDAHLRAFCLLRLLLLLPLLLQVMYPGTSDYWPYDGSN